MKPLSDPISNTRVKRDLRDTLHSGILDYRSEALPTWCPGCGYYGITHGLTLALNEMKIPNQNLVIVSGIGCAGRYPFFVRGYGVHAVHGRALPVACGIKMADPALTVIAVGGDGDGLGIGGGHLLHAIRRNVDVTYVLFDNAIYGLTKGQASPTTPQSQVTKTTPFGNPDVPIQPIPLALACRASFVAGGYAGLPKELVGIFRRALKHRGFSFVVVTTPCVTFDRVNITYDGMRDAWSEIPKTHQPSDFKAAVELARDAPRLYGVYYEDNRPEWMELQGTLSDR
ncbi:2-oxoacid:ferredoxin oxidoreductase subunit beta [bacterium]|nr:2-oxoacid:ferredoxin oxidoreductase subunit beta [candidate division CSSED10-310 bacterium]